MNQIDKRIIKVNNNRTFSARPIMTRFKIKPRTTDLYFAVFVFDTKQQMYDYYKNVGGQSKLDFAAITMPYDHIVNNIPTNEVGAILFNKESGLGSGITSHETVHAALRLYRILIDEKGNIGDDIGEKEESLAYFVSDLYNDLVNKLYGAKIYG